MRSFLLTTLVACSLLVSEAVALPSPDPKGVYFRRARQRHRLANSPAFKRSVAETSCTEEAAEPYKAPKRNIWGGLTVSLLLCDEQTARCI